MNTAHTFSRRWLRRPLKVVFAVVAIAALAACAHLPLYNKEKDELAKSAQKAYTDTKVTEALNVQERNLEMLLKAETAALNESASLRLDIALLRMSDDRPTTDGSTSLAGWYERAKTAEENLGFPDSSRILAFLDYQIEVAQAEIQIATVKARIGSDGSKALKALPSCKAVRNDDLANLNWKYTTGIEANKRAFLMIDYKEYVLRCQEALTPPPVTGGRIGVAFAEMLQVEAELGRRKAQAKALAEEVKTMMGELKKKKQAATSKATKLANAEKSAEKVVDEAKDTADKLLDALKELREVVGGEGADRMAVKNIEAINTMLAAIGSGQANAEGLKDKRLKTAVTWIQSNIPSLAADMAAFIDSAQAVPISNLILELQHQIIEQNYAKALTTLSKKRLEMLRARYRTLVDSAGAWRGFRLALCNFAVLSSNKPHPGALCDTFKVNIEKAVDRATVACTIGGKPVTDCALKLTWREALDETTDNRQKRELYSALYQYAEAFEAERASREAEFHLADLDHREALAAQRSGIEAWNNLVAVPIGQLAAYHASGIKPEAIADLIATVLGMSAIGAGAAQ